MLNAASRVTVMIWIAMPRCFSRAFVGVACRNVDRIICERDLKWQLCSTTESHQTERDHIQIYLHKIHNMPHSIFIWEVGARRISVHMHTGIIIFTRPLHERDEQGATAKNGNMNICVIARNHTPAWAPGFSAVWPHLCETRRLLFKFREWLFWRMPMFLKASAYFSGVQTRRLCNCVSAQ